MLMSVVICYRDADMFANAHSVPSYILGSAQNRRKHLEIIVPRLHEVFKKYPHEIIVVEQNDTKKFRRGNLLNVGASYAKGEWVALHDVDYYPVGELGVDLQYFDYAADVFLPVKRVEFVRNDLTPRPIEDIPGGYRHFKNSVDDDFYGGVSVFNKDAFFLINGFSPMFVGWGFDDSSLRNRIKAHKLVVMRAANNLFYALDHPDSGPSMEDPDFRRNIELSSQHEAYKHTGVNNMPFTAEEVTPKLVGVDKWVLATNFDPPPPAHHKIVSSKFDFAEME